MQQNINYQQLTEKWAPLLDHEGSDPIKDAHRRNVTAVLLENQEQMLREENAFQSLTEASPTNSAGTGGFSGSSAAAGPVAGFDPVLISLIRRAMPNLVAYDLAGVQPMSGPTGLIFAMRSRFTNQSGTEALFDEPDTSFSGQNSSQNLTGGMTDVAAGFGTTSSPNGTNPGVLNPVGSATTTDYSVGQGMVTGESEALGDAAANAFQEMAFSIEKVTVTAKSRALKAEYSLELAQDLKAIHGLNAESELANILSTEILAEINREIIRVINAHAKPGAQSGQITKKGIIDLDTDVDGRWSAEKFKGLGIQIDREANQIAKDTRRGKGNVMVCSSDVASALAATGMLDYSQVLASNTLNVDDTGNTFAGTLNGRMKVYIDPYATVDYITVGYKGANAYDAGLFYCPYVPLTMMRAVAEDTFQPKIGFKTRYGLASNPFTPGSSSGLGTVRQNQYYRIMRVDNILNT